jgi:Reverse transcriptase (RNA-dependent DNA polymerase)
MEQQRCIDRDKPTQQRPPIHYRSLGWARKGALVAVNNERVGLFQQHASSGNRSRTPPPKDKTIVESKMGGGPSKEKERRGQSHRLQDQNHGQKLHPTPWNRLFFDTFAPVATWTSMLLIMTIAAVRDWAMRQINVKSAYLNAPIKEEIYVRDPQRKFKITLARAWYGN